MVACVKGTLSNDIIAVLEKINIDKRLQVKEVTLDMANNMELSMRKIFPNASIVTDRFHVVQLVMEALQHCRIKERWIEMDKENEAIKESKKDKKPYIPTVLENGETPKQLLARCRYVLAKKSSNWTERQEQQADILFKRYPNLHTAYKHCLEFRNIYEDKNRVYAKIRFTKWIDDVERIAIKEFNTVAYTVKNNLDNILNFFINRNTNANAESFNSKIKLFRANQRGVVDTTFFLFRLHKLFG